MIENNLEDIQNTFFDTLMVDVNQIRGLDFVYFLDGSGQVIREKSFTESSNHLEQVKNIISQNPFVNEISSDIYGEPFKICTFLNERGLIILSRICDNPNLYMVLTGGEKEPVDLINLLRLVKESFNKLTKG